MSQSITFVILHYNTIKETEDCVQSIKEKTDSPDYQIVIVDNASPNGSGKVLKERYKAQEKVTVLLCKHNLGFAKGNNVGYQYAIRRFHPKFICILNNDTLLEKDQFFYTVNKEYERSHFGVLGPKIVLKNGKTNGLYYRFPDKSYFENELRIHKRELWQMERYLNYPIVACKLCRNVLCNALGIKRRSRHEAYFRADKLEERWEDIVLHGCCLIFSPAYIEAYEDAFYPETFLYKEEELLYLRCRNKGLKTVYNPELEIRHLEDVATNSITVKKRKKEMFWLENQIQSLEILLKVMENGG